MDRWRREAQLGEQHREKTVVKIGLLPDSHLEMVGDQIRQVVQTLL